MTYEDIYNKHLQDYYDEYMHEMGDFRDEDDDFDIFVDPEELSDEMLLMNDTSSKPLCEISVVENDDDVSVLSVK
jgi:hypothetical protein